MSVVCDKAEAYLRTSIGSFALTKPVVRPGLTPKRFLIQISPERLKELEEKQCRFKEATIKCVETKTGAKFCLIRFEGTELEGMEMCLPVHRFKHIIEKKEEPSIQECRAVGKIAFLVVEEKRV